MNDEKSAFPSQKIAVPVQLFGSVVQTQSLGNVVNQFYLNLLTYLYIYKA